jgi:hypothetical protein
VPPVQLAPPRVRGLPALLAAALAIALTGCGAGRGPEQAPDEVALTVTRDFGARDVVSVPAAQVEASDTVLRLLQRNAPVTTRSDGRFVQSIAGLEGGRRGGRPHGWRYFVNGVLVDEGAGAVRVRRGDRIWWDHHDRGAAMSVPAVVGSFPEPFLHGIEGDRLPVRVECADPADEACDMVADRLAAIGVVVGRGGIGAGDNLQTLRVLVGPWRALRGRDAAVDLVDAGPGRSGVYALFDGAGSTLTVLDPRARPARRLGAGTGLVAATRPPELALTWIVTGTDASGTRSAARALDESALGEAFALAVSEDRAVRVPEVERSRAELERSRAEVERSRAEVERSRAELERSRAEVER